MSRPILTPDALRSEARPFRGQAWRFVEAQHRVSTLKLVDSLAEQVALEDILEETKPSVPDACRHLDYLLSTPFRYRSYPNGSRFRRAGLTPGVWYGAERFETAAAEMVFYRLVFYAGSVPIVLGVGPAALFGKRAVMWQAHQWARLQRWCARTILGITTRVEGVVPEGQYLFAAKHQAMYETTELQLILRGPAMVLKRELTRIPVWGWATRLYGSISVDREASAKALRQLMTEGAALRARGRGGSPW